MNTEFLRYKARIARINRIKRGARLFALLALLGALFAGLGYNTGRRAGIVAGVELLTACESAGGSGFILGVNGEFDCLYE